MNGITPRPEPEIYEIKIREHFINNSLGFLSHRQENPTLLRIRHYY